MRKSSRKLLKPNSIVAALANLGGRIEKLEGRTIERATEAISLGSTGLSAAKSPQPPTSIEMSINRIHDIIMRLNRATVVASVLADQIEGGAPTPSGEAMAPNERPCLGSTISMLDRAVDNFLDQLGRVHPNPRA